MTYVLFVLDNETNRRLKAPIKFLGISVGKFEDIVETKKTKKILDYFTAEASKEIVDKTKDSKENDSHVTKQTEKLNPKNNGKDYIMKKFFQVSEKSQILKNKSPQTEESHVTEKFKCVKSKEFQPTLSKQNPIEHQPEAPILESTLENQESFFAKMLNQNLNTNPRIRNIDTEEKVRPITPLCDIVKCGEDTNDTDYSGSTINDEIDKNMALFEEDPDDVARVTSIRQLLNTSKIIQDEEQECDTISDPERIHKPTVSNHGTPQKEPPPPRVETFVCPECGKSISIDMVEMHSDYHLALKLRDEERQQSRREKLEKTVVNTKSDESKKKKQAEETSSIRNEVSVASFLIKIDNNVPTETCSECGKRIPLEKFGEHLDFHEAQKLSRELNKKISPKFTGSTVKRKRKSASPVKKNKMPCRPIDSFFK